MQKRTEDRPAKYYLGEKNMNMDFERSAYLLVSDYVKPNSGKDVADELQELILNNPKRVLYFPDGEYLISKPICTPGNPEHSVCLHLSNYATIKATADWNNEEAMIRLGAAEPFNSIAICGSNYYLTGGIIDGSGVANGVSIDSGRETRIDNLSIKHTKIGLYVKYGANSSSSDADICNVNIYGNGQPDSIGLLIEGCDNTFTNMRIARVQIGVKLVRGGNTLRNIHPLYGSAYGWDNYASSVAFYDIGWDNRYDFCYSDQYATGFYMRDGLQSIYHNCLCFWWTTVKDIGGQVGFKADGKFCSLINCSRVSLRGDCTNKDFLVVGAPGGNGIIMAPVFNEGLVQDKSYKDYLQGPVLGC